MSGTERPDVEPEAEEEKSDKENFSEDPEKQIDQKDEISETEDKTRDNTDENIGDNDIVDPSKDECTVKSKETNLVERNDNDNNECIVMTEETNFEEKNDNKDNKVVTVELSGKETERNSPEIVVEPKFSERLPSDKLTSQNIRVLTQKHCYVALERKQTPPSFKTSDTPSFFKKFKRCLLLAIFSATVIGYAIGGAYLFSYLERNREIEYNAKIDKWKNDTAILLATELRQVIPYEEVWARKVFQHLEIFEKDLLKASAVGYRRFDHEDREQRWTWTSSLFFSIVLMTTTGYGPMTPRSKVGRIAAMFYSLFGIPLAFSWLMIIGYTLATFWASLFQNICCRLCHEKPPDNLEVTFSPARHKDTLKLPKLRTNSIVPLDEQRLIAGTDSHSGKDRRSMFPPECHKEYSSKNSSQMKQLSGNIQNSACNLRKIEMEQAQIREVYHTMDYATAIVYASLLFVVYYMFFSILFAVYEGWILTDVLYFSYLMFVTLGPGCHEMEDDGSEIKIKNNILYTIHLCIGYCILAMIINLICLLFQGRYESDKVQRCEALDSFPRRKF